MNTTNKLGSFDQQAEHCGDVPFIDPMIDVTTGHQIVAFSTIESPILESVPVPADIPSSDLTNLHEGREHTVKDILCREYAFQTFTIPVGGVAGAILQTWNPLDIFLSQLNVLDKISGFAFLRTNLLLRLEFVTVPTVQGGIMLSYYPDVTLTSLSSRIGTRLQFSQVPNLQQSLTTAVSMQMKVPWISPFYGRDIVNGFGNIGTLYLTRLTPSAGAIVQVTAYISADPDTIDIQYPTLGSPSLSMDMAEKLACQQIERLCEMRGDLSRIRGVIKRFEVPEAIPETQMLRRLRGSNINSSESDAMEQKGVISGLLTSGQKIAQIASGIPKIGAVASAVAPLLGIGSRLAGLFGLSKPSLDKPLRAVRLKPGDDHLTSEGLIPSHFLTINRMCGVDSSANPFGSQADEMSVEAIMQVPNIIGGFNVTTAQLPNTVLDVRTLTLAHFDVINAVTGAIIPTHQYWLSSACLGWLANLNFDFDAYLTHFHRVKLRFTVLPHIFSSTALIGTVYGGDLSMASSAVVEFSGDCTNYSIKIEPRTHSPMKLMPRTRSGSTPVQNGLLNVQNTVLDPRVSFGTLLVTVEVPLQVSSVVANNVDFVVSFSADNVVLSYPKSYLSLLPETQGKVSTLGTTYAKQSRSEHMIRGTENLVSNSAPIDKIENVKTCMGDAIVHLKNLSNAFGLFAPSLDVVTRSGLLIEPFVFRSIATNPVGVGEVYLDWIDTWAKGFAFFKGGINVRIALTNVGVGIAGHVMLNPVWDRAVDTMPENQYGIVYNSTSTFVGRGGTRTIPISGLESVTDINVPYYQQFHMSQVNGRILPAGAGAPAYGQFVDNSLFYLPDTDQTLRVFRNLAEDFRFGFLMSLPVFRVSGMGGIYVEP